MPCHGVRWRWQVSCNNLKFKLLSQQEVVQKWMDFRDFGATRATTNNRTCKTAKSSHKCSTTSQIGTVVMRKADAFLNTNLQLQARPQCVSHFLIWELGLSLTFRLQPPLAFFRCLLQYLLAEGAHHFDYIICHCPHTRYKLRTHTHTSYLNSNFKTHYCSSKYKVQESKTSIILVLAGEWRHDIFFGCIWAGAKDCPLLWLLKLQLFQSTTPRMSSQPLLSVLLLLSRYCCTHCSSWPWRYIYIYSRKV